MRRELVHSAWGHEPADMPQAQLRIGTRIAGAYRGRRSLGDYNEDHHREKGHRREAPGILHFDGRRRAVEQEVDAARSSGMRQVAPTDLGGWRASLILVDFNNRA